MQALLPYLAQAQSMEATALATKVVMVLGITAGLLLVITHYLKKMGYGTGTPVAPNASAGINRKRRAKNGQTGPAISVEHIMPITRQAKVATINVDGHRLVVGITDQQVSLLKDLSADGPEDAYGDGLGNALATSEPVTGELERYPIDPAIIRAAQLRSRRAD